MFAKLLKYEWKASAPLLGILSLAALGTGLLGGVSLRLLQVELENTAVQAALMIIAGLSLVLLFLALAAYGLSITLLLLHRFYKSKFTNEGYLTFTLPVNSHQIFLSSWLNLLIWQIISVVVVVASVTLAVAVGGVFPDDRTVFLDMQMMFRNAAELWGESSGILYQVLYTLTTWLYGTVMMLTCIVLGASWAKKHKLLLAFVLYYAFSGLVSVVSTILTVVLMLTGIDNGDPAAIMSVTSLSITILTLVLTVGGYFFSTHMMSKRLNLN